MLPAVLRDGRKTPVVKMVDHWGATRDRQWQQFLRESLRHRDRIRDRELAIGLRYSTDFYA